MRTPRTALDRIAPSPRYSGERGLGERSGSIQRRLKDSQPVHNDQRPITFLQNPSPPALSPEYRGEGEILLSDVRRDSPLLVMERRLRTFNIERPTLWLNSELTATTCKRVEH